MCVRARACMVSARVRPRARFFASVSPCVPVRVRVRPHPHTRNSAAIVKADGMGAVVALLELLLPEPREPLINICVEVRCVRVCVVVAVGEQASSREDPSRVNMYIT